MEILFKNLEKLIDALNGIEKTRELILHLAVQGKLTEKDPDDEPASELLKKIKTEKEKLIAEGKIKKQKEPPPIKDEEIPFELPKGWEWARLEVICTQITDGTHHTPKYISKGIPFLSVKDLSSGVLDFTNTKFISETEHKELIRRCKPEYGDILLTKVGTTGIAKVVDVRKEFSIFVSVALLKIFSTLIFAYYLEHLINSPLVKKYSKEGTEGVGNKNLVLRKIKLFVVPIPPLNEQKRIVEKVNSLMSLLDELEGKRERRNQKRIKLNNASLEPLLTSKDDEELKTSWKRIEENFSTLYSIPENIEKLKQAILQLAVQGKLVKQDPNDEPASELLRKIKIEKEKLIAEGKIKKQKELPPITDDEKPFELPKGWEWVRLGEVTNYGINLKSEGNGLNENTWVLELEDIEKITSRIIQKVRYKEKKFKSTKNYFQKGDVIYGKLRPYLDKVVVADEDGVCTTEMIPILGYYNMDPYYIRLVLKTPYFVEYATNSTHGMNLPRLGTDKARMAVFPLTSLREQKLIVKKVNELMSLCRTLEEKLREKEETTERLVGTIVDTIANNKTKDDKKKIINGLMTKHSKALEKLS